MSLAEISVQPGVYFVPPPQNTDHAIRIPFAILVVGGAVLIGAFLARAIPFIYIAVTGSIIAAIIMWSHNRLQRMRRCILEHLETHSDALERDAALIDLMCGAAPIARRGRRNAGHAWAWGSSLPQIVRLIEPGRAFLRGTGVSIRRFEPMEFDFEPISLRDWREFPDPAAPVAHPLGSLPLRNRVSWSQRSRGDMVHESLAIGAVGLMSIGGAIALTGAVIDLVFVHGSVTRVLQGFFACALPFALWLLIKSAQRDWHIFPSGLAIRTRWSLLRSKRFEFFTRQDSILLYWGRTLCAVRRDGAMRRTMANPGQMEAIMRAWLSPQPAPPIEQLREWFGEAA